MKFLINVSHLANFYFFIQNLSEWHFSNIKPYNVFWEKTIGPFSEEEKEALSRFKTIRQNYPYENKTFDFDGFFYSQNDWFFGIKKHIKKSEYVDLNDIFHLFCNKFDKLYSLEKESLYKWQECLVDYLKDINDQQKIFEELSIVYSAISPPKNFRVNLYVLISAPGGMGGSADDESKRITLEVSRSSLQNLPQAAGNIWHEIIHIYFDKKHFRKLLNDYFGDDAEMIRVVNELTAAALFPGILGRKFFNNPKKETIYYRYVNKEQSEEILSLMQTYLYGRKPLDDIYIQRICEVLNKKAPHTVSV